MLHRSIVSSLTLPLALTPALALAALVGCAGDSRAPADRTPPTAQSAAPPTAGSHAASGTPASASAPAAASAAAPAAARSAAAASAGRASCRAVAEAFADAVNRNDGAAWRALYAPIDRLEAAVTCTDRNPFASFVRDELSQDESWDLQSRSADGDHRYDEAASKVEATHVAAPGEPAVEGCTAREAISVESLAAFFRYGDTANGGVRRFTCVGLADGWYAIQIN